MTLQQSIKITTTTINLINGTHKHVHRCGVHLNDMRIIGHDIRAYRVNAQFRFDLFISLLQIEFWLLQYYMKIWFHPSIAWRNCCPFQTGQFYSDFSARQKRKTASMNFTFSSLDCLKSQSKPPKLHLLIERVTDGSGCNHRIREIRDANIKRAQIEQLCRLSVFKTGKLWKHKTIIHLFSRCCSRCC